MGNLCATPQQDPVGPKKEPVVFKKAVNGILFEVINADVTSEKIDAIVNPSNTQLLHNSGISQSLAIKGGEEIQIESNKIVNERGSLKIGEAVVTGAGNLKNAKYIIHAVLPVWRGGNEQEVEQLNEAVRNTLVVADEKNVKSIAFPALGGTGVYGFPKEVATKGLVLTCLEYTKNKNPNKTVINIKFMNADQAITKFFQESVETLLSQPNFEEKRVAEEHCLAEQQRRAEQKAREEAKEHRLAEEKRIAEDLETARLLEKNKSSKQPQPNTNKSGENMHAGAHPQEESKHQPLIRNKYIASR